MPVRHLLIGILLFPAVPIMYSSDQRHKSVSVQNWAVRAFEEGVKLRERAPEKARTLFQTAADLYETRLRDYHAENPAIYCNLGNAYLLAGDLPRAILAYRRGLRLDPGNRELQRNLAYAREQVDYPPFGNLRPPVANQWPPWFAPKLRLVLAVVFYSLGWLALTRWRMIRRGWPLAAAGLAFAAAACLSATLAIEDRQNQWEARHPLVIIKEDGVILRKGNGIAYPARFDAPLNHGVEARLLFERGDWLQIELAGGEVGWVPRGYALLDIP